MRKPRAIIYSRSFRNDLVTFFIANQYEICVRTEYVTFPIYCEQENNSCACPVLCCDIMVVVEDDEQIRGVDHVNKQYQLGCKLTHRNKAIIANSPVHDTLDNTHARSTMIFANPLDLNEFETWVRDCEKRMDLSQRLVVIRRDDRHACSTPVQFQLPGEDADISAQVVNISSCGICLRISKPIERGQELRVRFQKAADADVGIVRWVKKIEEGWYLSGVTFCV